MIKNMNITLILLFTILFSSCSKSLDEYNKPAIYWYGKISEYIANSNLDKADDYYASLQGEHISSPLLPDATLMLAIAHFDNEEYLLSEHFLNEYINRYANNEQREFAQFLKIKAKYKSLPHPRRDQVLISETMKMAIEFEQTYPKSKYYFLVDSILTKLYMTQVVLNETIASLYDRIDKPRSAKYYRGLQKQPWLDWDYIQRDNTPWYREWFEGDGTASWYGFLIPDTVSVVSRNSIKYIENNNTKDVK